MDLEKVRPELRGAVRRVPAVPMRRAWVRRLARFAQRHLVRPAVVDGVEFRDVTAEGVAVRVYQPRSGRTAAGLLWIHGGGMIIGHPSQDDRLCSTTALALGMTVVSVDYRLAPDDPFPAAIDDCGAAWKWFQRSAEELGVDPTRIVVGGGSAGGGLAASLVHLIHDAGGVQPCAQLLFYPMLDDRTAADTALDEVKHFVWDNGMNRFGWRAYLGREPGIAHIPPYAVAARREDLRGLPSAWIGVGDIDLFYAEDVEYVRRLREAGIACELDVVEGAPHGFEGWGSRTSVAEEFVERSREWLKRAVTGANVQGSPPSTRNAD